jgi:hypothetical protein
MPSSKPRIEIVEQDGDVVEIRASGNTTVTVICDMQLVGQTLILNRLHLDGSGPGSSSIGELREMVREFGRQRGAKEVMVLGAKRTTGAAPGKVPRPIVIKVE